MGRKLASLAGIVAAALAFGLGGAIVVGHTTGQPAGHHTLAEDQGPTRVV